MSNHRQHRRFLPQAVQNFLWGSSRAGRNTQDRGMSTVQEAQSVVQPDNRSDTSMPDLQSVSDSDEDEDSQDARDVEMHVVDDHNQDWTDEEDNEPNHRRPTVNDGDPDSPSLSPNPHPPHPAPPNTGEPPPRPNIPPWGLGAPPSDFSRLFPLFSQQSHSNDNTPPPPGPARPHVHAHAYVLAMDMNGRPIQMAMGPPQPQPPPPAAAPQPQGPQGMPMFDFIIGPGGGLGGGPNPPFGVDMPTWADVMQMFGREADGREDPERAKKLVAGLEQVPSGLVKRMIRVGGAPGGHVDQAQTQDSETPGCAICWDSLLTDAYQGEEPTNEEAKIISLPCSHVFHASCLVPWFSKPRHTTCPTCRFDIDPENLTYNPRRPQPREPAAPAAQPPSTPTSQEQPVGEHPSQPQQQQHPQGPPEAEQPQVQPNVPHPQNNGPAPNLTNVNTFFFPQPPQTPNQGDPPHNIPHRHHHGHTHGPGFTVDFTWQVPNNGEQDDERLAEDLQNQASVLVQQFLGGFPVFNGPMPRPGPRSPPSFGTPPATPADQRRLPKEWSPPPAPGPTLRQRVETKEREAGLRCDDASCGIGPSDEDPCPSQLEDPSSRNLVSISQQTDHDLHVCSHKFHPSCLVSADRCSGWGEDVERDESQFEVVACPMCRAVGNVPREVWDQGADTLLV